MMARPLTVAAAVSTILGLGAGLLWIDEVRFRREYDRQVAARIEADRAQLGRLVATLDTVHHFGPTRVPVRTEQEEAQRAEMVRLLNEFRLLSAARNSPPAPSPYPRAVA